VEGAVDRLREALDWAGLDYDEGELIEFTLKGRAEVRLEHIGIGRGGPHGPYIQVNDHQISSRYMLMPGSVRATRPVPSTRPASPLRASFRLIRWAPS